MNPDSLMEPDNYQQAWQAQSSQTRVTIDADRLLTEALRSQSSFRAIIFWRDFREVAVALLMIPLWFMIGFVISLPWTWYLTVPALVWIAAFLLVDRKRHPQKPAEPGEPLLESVKKSLPQVEHQIWLLRNVFWWYLLPPSISCLAFFAQVSWQSSASLGPVFSLVFFLVLSLFVAAVYVPVYFLNQNAVRTQLEPRRDELLALIASLTDETAGEVSGAYPILTSAAPVQRSRRRLLIAGVCFVVLASIGFGGAYLAYQLEQDYPKKSPFAAVRWQQSEPEVQVGDTWFKLS